MLLLLDILLCVRWAVFYQEISAIFHNILSEYYRLKNVSFIFHALVQPMYFIPYKYILFFPAPFPMTNASLNK